MFFLLNLKENAAQLKFTGELLGKLLLFESCSVLFLLPSAWLQVKIVLAFLRKTAMKIMSGFLRP